MATGRKTGRDELGDPIAFIAAAVNSGKAKAIKRIVKQLERMSPNDVTALERLIGKR